MIQETVTIENKLGLHARAAAVFVQLAHKFQSNIQLKKINNSAEQNMVEQDTDCSLNSNWVNGKSILNVMTLDAGIGSQIVIKAKGPDAQQALHRLVKLINDKFGEKE
ncbi:MAG: HPr family phosphocarrier protein [bacterium]|nr:HPr family phosphocarrier protein [bacterium]